MNVALKSTTNTLTKGTTDLITVNRIGNGLKFDGVNDYISVGSPASLQFFEADSFTAHFIINGLNSSYQRVFSYYWNNSFNGYIQQINEENIFFLVGGSNGNSSAKLIGAFFPKKANQIITIVKDGTDANNYKIYADGVSMPITVYYNFATPVSYSTGQFVIGALSFQGAISEYLNGTLYDLKIFNRVLTQLEVTQLVDSFSTNITGLTANLVADYNFNQKSGTQLTDNSVNQLHGTLTGFGATSNLGGGAWVNSLGNTITY